MERKISRWMTQTSRYKFIDKLKDKHGGEIPYDKLAYGELSSFIQKEGMKICKAMKLQKNQMGTNSN